MKTGYLSVVLCAALLTGCAQNGEYNRTAIGAGAGAVGGAVLGHVIGGNDRGTIVGAVVGGVAGGLIGRQMQQQKQQLEQATQGTGIQVTQQADQSVKLNIPGSISFDTNSSAIKPAFRPTLDRVATVLNKNPSTHIRIVGYTDNTGTVAYNQQLSLARANSTRNYLASRGVAANRVSTEGHGESEPVASNATADGRAQNRRVEIIVVPPAQS
jgi:outer membrane protein OmpA-like peptidoglycan-associated protein